MEAASAPASHPIRLRVDDDLRRSRLTVFFRLLLAIPHLIWLYLWAVVAALAALVNWFATLFTGRSPDGLHRFIALFLRYSTHVTAYVSLLADPWPKFTGSDGYPVDLQVDGSERQNRWITGFRIILAIPALIVASLLQQLMQIISFLAWFVCLAIGRIPDGMENLGAYCLRYQMQTYGYLAILTDRYPSFSFPKVTD